MTGDLQTDLALVIKPPRNHTIDLKLIREMQIGDINIIDYNNNFTQSQSFVERDLGFT